MTTYVLRDGELVEKDQAGPAPSLPGYYIISDNQGSLWHPVKNRHTDSKSTFRRWTVESGCREVGNDVNFAPKRTPPKLDKQQRARDIKTAIDQLRSGYRGP